MKIHLLYFASLRTRAGLAEEELDLPEGTTPSALWDDLKARFGWTPERGQCAIAVNDDYATWDTVLKDRDRVVFLTPIAGG